MEQPESCISCGRALSQGTIFPCACCSKTLIGRCMSCREQSVRYTCTECGFRGP